MNRKSFVVAALLAQCVMAQAQTGGEPVGVAGLSDGAVESALVHEKHKNGDWYVGLGVGYSHCMAENATAEDFIGKQPPSLNVMVGHNFSPTFGLRLTGGWNFQASRCNSALSTSMPDVFGDGRYRFDCWSAQLSGVLNLTNIFCGYDPARVLSWNVLFGGGAVGTYGFDKKVIEKWNETPFYPVDGKGGIYGVGHVGMQCCVQVAKAWDVGLEARVNVTDNNYNGVSNKNTIDFYMDAMVCVAYHLKNGKQGMRRMDVPGRRTFVDPVLKDCAVAKREVVAMGERMNAVVPFYAGFYYLNEASMMRVEQVARFLRSHPEVALVVEGHPDVVPDEDEVYHEHLAMCRAEAVKKALVDRFGVEPERLECVAVDRAMQTFKNVREWVPAVSFLMKER